MAEQRLLSVTLSYEGYEADDHLVDFYDVAKALEGFQRSLALTTHLVLNGEIITQAPSLRGASILAHPPEEGSWKFMATVLAGAYMLGTAPQDTVLGHLIFSAYDYVVSESLGVDVDFDKSLRRSFEEAHEAGHIPQPITEDRLDGVIEKAQVPLSNMHRPMIRSETARFAHLWGKSPHADFAITAKLTPETYDYLWSEEVAEYVQAFEGRVSSFNSNTRKGRIFIPALERTVPFELAGEAINPTALRSVGVSLLMDIEDFKGRSSGRRNDRGFLVVDAFPIKSRGGRIKQLQVVSIEER